MEQAPDRQAIASTTSRMDRPALIDIRYSTLCSPVHNESCSLLIAMLQLAPATRGSLNAAASRATAVGSKTVSASTVRSRSPLANRAAALIAALRPQRVPWQITMSTRPSARARSAMARVSSVEPSSTTMISTGRRVCRCSDAIVAPSPEPPLKVGMITLTETLPAGTLSLRLAHAEQSQRNQRQRVARNVEYQHREGEQEQVGSGEQLHHFEHATPLGRPSPRHIFPSLPRSLPYRGLEPIDGDLGALLFGLILALTFTLTLGVVTPDRILNG